DLRMVLLREWNEQERCRRLSKTHVFAVLHNADNFGGRPATAVHARPFADPILPGPEPADECFVDNDDGWSGTFVRHGEVAAMQDRNAHRLEVSWRRRRIKGVWVFAFARRISIDADATTAHIQGQRQITGQPVAFNPRQGSDATQRTIKKLPP